MRQKLKYQFYTNDYLRQENPEEDINLEELQQLLTMVGVSVQQNRYGLRIELDYDRFDQVTRRGAGRKVSLAPNPVRAGSFYHYSDVTDMLKKGMSNEEIRVRLNMRAIIQRNGWKEV